MFEYLNHKITFSLAIVFTMLIISTELQGQNSQYQHLRTIIFNDSVIDLTDSLTIIPESIIATLSDSATTNIKHQLILNKILISPQNQLSAGDTINITYRTLSADLYATRSHIDQNQLKSKDRAIYIGYEYSPFDTENKNALIQSKGLDYDGSFSRGFSFGNGQSLLLNSNFNLQLAGDLGNDITIKAAISDDNIPIQPEGNTQVLQEFDKVFIQVDKGKTRLIAGDFQEQETDSYFLRYLKKLKGLKAAHTVDLSEKSYVRTGGSFAQSQGKFSRQEISTSEGNQGPYRLSGNNGELFLIVRSGTERIYYDGRLLKRGIDLDYIISYDRAEITFTPKTLITKDSRIVVEFEYIDRSYQRTSYIAEATYVNGKFSFDTNLYTESDSKNLQQDIQLDSTDISILTEAGDDLSDAIRPSINLYDGDADPDLILYKQIVESTGNIYYEYSTSPDSANYLVSYSNVGANNGSYIIDTQSTANGRVYKYVGENLGSFEPIKRLVAPQKKQIMTFASQYKATEQRIIKAELAVSQTDLNRFSEVDNEDNTGNALSILYDDLIKLDTVPNGWSIAPQLSYEYVNKNFLTINPYRSPEFSRDWNQIQSNDTLINNQQIITAGLKLQKAKSFKLGYTYKSYEIKEQYKGNKHLSSLQYQDSVRSITVIGDLLNSESLTEKTTFLRPTVALKHRLPFTKNWSIKGDLLSERNERRDLDQDSLKNTSFAFNQYDLAIQNRESSPFYLSLGYQYRHDDVADGDTFTQAFVANKYAIASHWKQGKSSDLTVDLSYRELDVVAPDRVSQESGSNILGRIDYNWSILKGGIRSNTSFNIGSGQELKREFEYVEVERGEGNYIWVDQPDNNGTLDGERQQSEFISDTQSDTANFIIVTIFNNEFIRTNTNGINQNLRINPSKFVNKKNKKKWAKYLRKTSLITNFKLNQKTLKTNDLAIKDFFTFNSQDTNVVRYDGALNNTLFINRSSTTWDLQLGNRYLINKFTQVTGLETRDLTEYSTRLRLSPKKRIDLIITAAQTLSLNQSELFDDRNFDIKSLTLSPELSVRPTDNLRISIQYERIDKKQQIRDLESILSSDLTAEVTLRKAKSYNINTSISFIDVQFDAEQQNTPIAFELLNGLKAGKNYLWNIGFTKRLANNVDFIANYEGRKTGLSPMIHTARAQVKATF